MAKESLWKKILQKVGILKKEEPKLLEEKVQRNFRSEMSLRDVSLQDVLDRYMNADEKDIGKVQEELRYQLGINSNLMNFKDGKNMISKIMEELRSGRISEIKKQDRITSIQYKTLDGEMSGFYITPDGISSHSKTNTGAEREDELKLDPGGYLTRKVETRAKDDNGVTRETRKLNETIVKGDVVTHSRSEIKSMTETGEPYQDLVVRAKREDGLVYVERDDKITPRLSRSGYTTRERGEKLTPQVHDFAYEYTSEDLAKTKEEVPGYQEKITEQSEREQDDNIIE